jgi:O-antigen/teichoic acid export membrane protein
MAESHVMLAARGGGIVFAGRLFVWGTRFVLAVLLARILGADAYGLYSIALTVATLGAAFSVLGLDSAVVRYVAIFRRREDRPGLLGTLQAGIGLPMLAAAVAAIVMFLAAGLIARELIGDPRLEPILRIAAVLVPAMVANSVLSAALQGSQNIGWAVVAEQFSQPIVRFGILFAFFLVGLTAELAVLASTLATIVASVLLLVFVQRRVSLRGIAGGARRDVGTLLGFSLPVYFSNIVNAVGNNLQTLLLGAMASVASAGIFAVAAQVMLIGTIFHAAIVQAAMPIFAELQDAAQTSRLRHLYQTTSKWTFTLNLPFFLLAVIFPVPLLAIFGPEFVDGAPALAILAVASLINAATGSSGAILDMTGHTRIKLVNTTISVGLSIALNLLLIPSLGVLGAAIAVVGAVSSVNVLRVAEVRWLVKVTPYDRSWAKPLAAGLIAGAAALLTSRLLPDDALVQGVVGIPLLLITYGVILMALGLNEDDRLILSRAARKFRREASSRAPDDGPTTARTPRRSEVP